MDVRKTRCAGSHGVVESRRRACRQMLSFCVAKECDDAGFSVTVAPVKPCFPGFEALIEWSM